MPCGVVCLSSPPASVTPAMSADTARPARSIAQLAGLKKSLLPTM